MKYVKYAAFELIALVLMLCTSVRAESIEVFQQIVSGQAQAVAAQQILIDDELLMRIPEGWTQREIDEEIPFCFTHEDDRSQNAVLIYWEKDTEGRYDSMLEELDNISDVTCRADRSGFVWVAGNTQEGVTLVQRGDNGRIYVFGFLYQSEDGCMSERVIRDFNVMIQSLRPADDADRKLMRGQVQDFDVGDEEPVAFADDAFESMLREAMGCAPEDPVYPGMLAAIERLYITDGKMDFFDWQHIQSAGYEQTQALSLSDLSLFPNLKELYVCDMQVTDMETIGRCAQLESLSLIGCGVESCEPFRNMTTLTHLSLARNEVRDIQPLEGLANLEYLNLYWCPVSDITAVGGMPALKGLLISGTRAASLEPLRTCTALEWLKAADIAGSVLSLEPLGGLKQLDTVELENTDVRDKEHIAHVENVRTGRGW